MKTGIYFCNCSGNISNKIDSAKIEKKVLAEYDDCYFKTFELLCAQHGKEFLEKDLLENKPERIVIMACSPRDHEATFMQAVKNAGINPYLMQMVNIREMVAWVAKDGEEATAKASRYLSAAMERVKFQEALETEKIDINPDVLVIGAGPAGFKVALSLAKAGRSVTLVEKNPVIGGLPVRYEEVYPNMECGPCMLEHIMDEILNSEKIQLLTMAQVTDVVGFYGNFIAKVKQEPRYVEIEKCIGCGACIEVCPVSVKNSYNQNLDDCKAISFPFEGALPYVPYIKEDVCLHFKDEKCQACVEACFVEETIQFEQKVKEIEVKAGSIVLAIGSDLYDCSKMPQLGYGKFADVYTAMDFERIIDSNGPTTGELITTEGKPPASIAIIHCAGSMDKDHQEYCSGICCSYGLKFNRMTRHKLSDTKIYHFIRELVVPGKDSTTILKNVQEDENTFFIRYKELNELELVSDNNQKVLFYQGPHGDRKSLALDMAVLCPPVIPNPDAEKFAEMLDLKRDKYGFFDPIHDRVDATTSNVKGVYIAGSCHSPQDIRDSISQGMAVTGSILSSLVEGEQLEISPVTAVVDADSCSGCGVCRLICPYKAISYDREKQVSKINDVLCQGCGTCVAACPSGSIEGNHFSFASINAEIEGLLK